MAYLGGHMRWLNNPYKGDAAGSGAWPTEGLAVVDTRNGLPFSWNPGRERGLGVFDFLPTESMLWAVSDTNTWAGEFRQRLAAFPFDGGFTIPPDEIGRLPGDVWQLGSISGAGLNDQRMSGFDGTDVNAQTTALGDESWNEVTGAFAVDDTVYATWSNGTFTAQPYDGVSFGSPSLIDLYAGDPSTSGYANNFINDLALITGLFYDPVRARIYYTMQGSPALFWRPFTPESQVVGAARRTLPKVSALSPKRVQGMFLTSGQLHFADRTTGVLKRIEFDDNRLVGTATVVNSAVDWRANALLLSSQWATLAPNATPVAAFSAMCTGLTCDVDASNSSDADGGIVDYSVDYGDGTVASGVNSQHQYVADGTYTVTVTVTDNRGAASSELRTVSVARPVNIDPSAVFSVGCWGLECDVDASASTDSDGNIVAYDWDFGGSSTGSGPTTSHVFAIEGTYSVSVTVTDDRGGVDTATQEVVVNAIPTSIAFRAADSADGGNGSLPSVAIPAATQVSDLMLLFISNATSRIADTPSGWTDLGAHADDDLRTQVFWRFASVEDLGTVVSARLRDVDGLAQSAPNTSMIAVYSGVDAPPVVDAASASEGTTVNGGVTDHTTPHVMVPANGQWLVSYWADRSASLTTSWTAPSGELLRAEEFSSGSSSRAASLLTDGGGPIRAGMRGGLTATADGASRKATMWSIVLRTR
ncbi:MAG: PKD domain-containing protein, partial [Actinomycetia bacterium]|nr:PKD domain-containing protein [Actinomycetes bacterium]